MKSFKELCKGYANEDRHGKITIDNEDITEKDYVSEISYEDSCIANGIINGTTNNKSVSFKTINYTKDLLDKEATIELGIDNDDVISYNRTGFFTITEEEIGDTTTGSTYKGSNDLSKLDKVYVCGIEDLENATIGDFWEDACKQAGLTYYMKEFRNSDLVVGGNPFTNNETIRTVLSNVASAGLYYLDIDAYTNVAELRWLSDTLVETFEKEDYSDLKKNQVYGPVNSLVIRDTYTEGENVTIEQNKESVTTKVYGNIEQETTTGKNLCSGLVIKTVTKAGVTCTQNADSSITLNGTCTTDNTTFAFDTNYLKTILAKNLTTHTAYYVSGSCTKNSSGAGRCVLRINYNDLNSVLHLESLEAQKTISVTNTRDINTTGWEWGIRIDKGDVFDNFTFKYMLANSTDTTYEPYTNGASPNPEFPQEIKTLSGIIILKRNGSNFLSSNYEQGSISSDGSPTSSSTRIRTINFVDVIPSHKFTLAVKSNKTIQAIIYEYDNAGNFVKQLTSSWQNLPYTFTVDNDTHKIKTVLRISGNLSIAPSDVTEEVLCLGETAVKYEPYIEKIDNIDLQGNEMCTDDELIIEDNGNVKLIKKRDDFTIDGNSELRIPATNENNIVFCNLNNTSIYDYADDTDKQYCTHLEWKKKVYGYQDALDSGVGMYTYIQNGNKYVYFVIPKSIASNLTTLKDWVSKNNLKTYYKLATPIEIDLGVIEDYESFIGENNITILANTEPSKFENVVEYLGNETIYQYGEPFTVSEKELVEFDIDDNYFLFTEDLKRQAISRIWDKVKGFTYTDMTLTSYTGKPFLRRGDKIRVQDMDGNYFDTYALKHTFLYDGSFKSVIEAPALDTKQTAFKNTQSITNKFRNAERKIDKVNGQIRDFIESADKNYAKKAELSITEDRINASVSNTLKSYATNGDLEQVTSQVQTALTDSSLAIQISREIQQTGVDKVVTSNNYEFSSEGLKISDSQSSNSSIVDNTGSKNYSYGVLQSIFNYKGSGVKKLIVTESAQIGYHKIQKNSVYINGSNEKMTSFYYLENLIEDLTDLEVEE